MQDCTEIWKEQPANAEHSCSGSPGGSRILMFDVFSNTNLCAMHGKHVTIMKKEMVPACCI
jgi:hypothetical protein